MKTFSEVSDFAPRKARVSYETIRLIMYYTKSYKRSWKEIASLAHVSDETAINVFDKYMNPSREKLSQILSMDECYNKGRFHHAYSCILFNFSTSKLLDVIDGREKNTLIHYFNKINREERANVQYVVMDMWEPYLDVASLFFPHALVAIDSFHVIQNIIRAVNDVRKKVMSRYKGGTVEYYLLKKWHYLIYQSPDPGEEKAKIKGYKNKWFNRYEIKQLILSLDEELKYATYYCSLYQYHNEHSSKEEFTIKIETFINDENIIKIKEFVPVVEMLSNWKPYILNSFIKVNGRRLSNGPIENFNARFKELLNTSPGLYTHRRFRNRLMYTYNNIDSYTLASEPLIKPKRGKRGPYKKSSNPKK